MADNSTSILIPMVRHVMPTILANEIVNEIVGVQPMLGPAGSIFSFSEASIYFTHEPHEFGKYLLHIHFEKFGVMGEGRKLLAAFVFFTISFLSCYNIRTITFNHTLLTPLYTVTNLFIS